MTTETNIDLLRESGIKAAVAEVLQIAGKAYKWAAICRASTNPDIAALAPLYETIAETWEAHSVLLLEANPQKSPSP